MHELATCPGCQQWIRLPARLDVDSTEWVCPHCDRKYRADAFQIVEVPVVRPAVDSPPREVDLQAPVISTGEGVEASAARARRDRKSARQGRLELLKIVLGGLAGLAIAQLLLWWLPGPWKRDPIGLAARLPSGLAFLAPASFRQPALTENHEAPPRSTVSGSNPTDSRGDEIARLGNPAQPADSLTTRTYQGEDLQNALADVLAELRNTSSSTQSMDQRRDVNRTLYERWCNVAHIVTFVELRDPQIGRRMKAVEALLVRIARDPALCQLVQKAAPDWLEYSGRGTDGVVLIGTVLEIEEQGRWYRSSLQLSEGLDAPVRLMTHTHPQLEPRQPFRIGERLLVFGSIISSRQSVLPDLTEDERFVIWDGFHLPLPTTEP